MNQCDFTYCDVFDYDGLEKTPEVLIKYGDVQLVKDVDYSVSYSDNINAGTASITIVGVGDYTGEVVKEFQINARSINAANVKLSQTSFTYDGKAKQANLTVTDGVNTLAKSTDYTVSYSNNINIGKATVKVTGTGNYCGEITKTFNILPKAPSIKTEFTCTTNAVRINWNKVDNATGYRVFRYNETSRQWESLTSIKNNSTTTYRIANLNSGTKYKYMVRAYKKVDDVNYWSLDSSTISTATKPTKVVMGSATRTSTATRINWTKINNCDGYEIYIYSPTAKKYQKLKTINSNSTVTNRQAGLTYNFAYQYKVRAFKNVGNGSKVYGEFSAVKTVLTYPTNSSLIKYTRLSPNFNKGRTSTVKKITIHHMAGNMSVEACGLLFSSSYRQVSSNYGIDSSGKIGMYVEEKNRAWTSSSFANDNQAITIEVANDQIGGVWHVSDKAIQSTIDLCVDICKRNGITKLVYNGTSSGNLTTHNMFASTACPGPYLTSKLPYIASQVNKKLGAK